MLNAVQKKGLIVAIVAVVIIVQASYALISAKKSSTPGGDVSSCGYIEDGESFFYMLKFSVNGIDVGGKATEVTPQSEQDSIKDKSVYACLDKLDSSKTYYLMIEEISSSGSSVAKTVAKISGSTQTVVWMSIQDQRLFVKNEETQAVAKDGSFSKDTAGNQTYRFTLKTSADTSASGKVDSMDSGQIATTSRILGLEYINYTADGNEMVSTGTSYGYGGTSEAYAGPKLESYDLGKYIGIFYITNDKSLSIKLDQGSKTYSVTSEDINYPVHKGAEIDYGYAIISETKLQGWTFDKFTATLYKGDVVYDTQTYDDSSGPGDITIIDGAGKTITISSPLTNVTVINSNIPKQMIMMGLDDSISTYYYGSNEFGIKAEELVKQGQTDRKLGTYYTPSVETLIKYKVEAVICPVWNMTLYSSVEKQCEQVGIKVIRLNCNGTTIIEDMTKISKLFGDPKSATTVLEEYKNEYNATLTAIHDTLEAAGGKMDGAFIQIMTSREAVYNQTSEVHTNLLNVFKKNITEETSLPTTGVTNPVNEGTIEEINKHGNDLTVAMIRSLDGMDFADAYKKFTQEYHLLSDSMPAMYNNRVYVEDTALMSGMYAHIGLLIIVKYVYGLEVQGYEDINKIIYDFQEKYKQSTISDKQILFETFGKDCPEGKDIVRYTKPTAEA